MGCAPGGATCYVSQPDSKLKVVAIVVQCWYIVHDVGPTWNQQWHNVSYLLGNIFPANTRHSPNVASMLAHRLRRWPNIEATLGECLVFAGFWHAIVADWELHK